MIDDFRLSEVGASDIQADICIVGAGPVGIALAEELEGSSLRVVIVESGGKSIEAELQALNVGIVAGLPHTGYLDGRGRALGGTSNLWAGQCLRLSSVDFEQREWVPYSGWPVNAEQLAPYYARAEAFFKISSESYDERTYKLFHLEPPHFTSETLINHFTVYTPEVDTARYHLPRLRNSDIRVLLHANVIQVETNEETTRVCGVLISTLDGKKARVRAQAIVLCAGGIENARILLSSQARRPDGLGNDADLVGRFFQEHPNVMTATLDAYDVGNLQERFRVLYRGSSRFFPKFGLSPELQRKRRILNCNAHLVFDYPEESGLNALRRVVHAARKRQLPERPLLELGMILRSLDVAGKSAIRRFVQGRSPVGKPTKIRLQCYLEQAPNPMSRICLARGHDRLGLPRLCVDWRVTDLERETLIAMTQVVNHEFKHAGFATLQPEVWLERGGQDWMFQLRDCSHHIGTTRMAVSPSNGVVDPNGQVFGVDGLYAAGSSVFPTSGYANPTLTAVALAMRLSDTLKHRFTAGSGAKISLSAS